MSRETGREPSRSSDRTWHLRSGACRTADRTSGLPLPNEAPEREHLVRRRHGREGAALSTFEELGGDCTPCAPPYESLAPRIARSASLQSESVTPTAQDVNTYSAYAFHVPTRWQAHNSRIRV